LLLLDLLVTGLFMRLNAFSDDQRGVVFTLSLRSADRG